MCVNDDDPNVKDQLLLQRSGTGNNSEPCAPSSSVFLENLGGLTEEKMPSGISVKKNNKLLNWFKIKCYGNKNNLPKVYSPFNLETDKSSF